MKNFSIIKNINDDILFYIYENILIFSLKYSIYFKILCKSIYHRIDDNIIYSTLYNNIYYIYEKINKTNNLGTIKYLINNDLYLPYNICVLKQYFNNNTILRIDIFNDILSIMENNDNLNNDNLNNDNLNNDNLNNENITITIIEKYYDNNYKIINEFNSNYTIRNKLYDFCQLLVYILIGIRKNFDCRCYLNKTKCNCNNTNLNQKKIIFIKE